ncbi:gephyrin-like molybdotransferase Glp [uncultured Gilvimarinus sp.]|uniref:molybdopterin molybdotransferase MoeA n=1 Tax=uncultured Gilvimarinus sp. TaxID=1689143 RepID=UPI0030DBA18C
MAGMLAVAEARERLCADARLQLQKRVAATQMMPLLQACGRILAQDVVAGINVPPAANSAMDGYALAAADARLGAVLTVSQRIGAGSVAQPLAAGTCARILTGAELPAGADTVVIQENCDRTGDQVTLNQAAERGDNIRPQGQDIAAGSVVLEAGRRLRAQDLALLASIGLTEVAVHAPLKVAVLATGDELVEPGEALKPGQIYNSNRYLLTAMLAELGAEVEYLPAVADTLAATCEALRQAAKRADIIVTTGGVSVGDADFVKPAVEVLGQLDIWRVALKPGKPLAFGRVGETPFIGLPGNPVSAFVTFVLLLEPYVQIMQGAEAADLEIYTLAANFSRNKPGGRDEYLRGRMTDEGVTLHPQQSSGALSSVIGADCLVWLKAGETVEHGTLVRVLPLRQWRAAQA